MVVTMIDDDHDKYNASCLQLETKRPTFTIWSRNPAQSISEHCWSLTAKPKCQSK